MENTSSVRSWGKPRPGQSTIKKKDDGSDDGDDGDSTYPLDQYGRNLSLNYVDSVCACVCGVSPLFYWVTVAYVDRKLLEKHWDTWLTKKDLENLKSAGIEHLRVPIGYWMLGEPFVKKGEPYVVGGWKYLMRAMGWAKELGLKMIIDLHGAPGE